MFSPILLMPSQGSHSTSVSYWKQVYPIFSKNGFFASLAKASIGNEADPLN